MRKVILQNYGITIYSVNDDKIGLKEILNVVGELGKKSVWKISDVECLGEAAETLHQYSDEEKEISGEKFYSIVSDIYQALDGTFEALNKGSTSNWLLIRLIRGDEIDIETEDKAFLNKFRHNFRNVKNLVY